MADFLNSLYKQVLLSDGALGTMLTQKGLSPGKSPELWMLENPLPLKEIHRDYLKAGAQVIQTNTFGANRLKLEEYNAGERVSEINLTAAKIAREIVGQQAFIAGMVGPTGHFPAPLGTYTWQELVLVFREQVEALAAGGVDLILLETFADLGEIRAALFAAKNYITLPVACSLTYTNGHTLTGTPPDVAAIVLEAMGADLIGANCSTGPRELLPIIKTYRQATSLPLLVEPNAGMPQFINGQTVYQDTPEQMAAFVEPFLQEGVRFIGACCGSTPAHIEAIGKQIKTISLPPKKEEQLTYLTSRSKLVTLGSTTLPRLIGERINPTARKSIAQALRKNKWSIILDEAFQQNEQGADLLDLNVGLPGANEAELLVQGVRQLQMTLNIPLILDSTNPEALERGLQEYQGKTLINSVNGTPESLDTLLPLAKKYGASVLGLTLDENGIPAKAEERFLIAKKIVNRALEIGLRRTDILIDCLVLTAATEGRECLETLKTIRLVKKHLKVNCILGLSNVSHGLPQRSWLNHTFLAMALEAGLDAAIANPADTNIQAVLAAGALLTGRDKSAQNYLMVAGKNTSLETAASQDPIKNLQAQILQGKNDKLIPLLKKLLKTLDPLTIIEQGVIPPLEKIGDLFANNQVFLPQLLLTSEAAKIAFTHLQAQLPPKSLKNKGTIILGTVKGDIHDIGKNIVKALLENHGYRIIDLGKNVPTEKFIETAHRENADIIGLSALMTTTMVEMEAVIKAVHCQKLKVKVLVGGAVVTAEYARQIGAHGYARDAGEAVHVVAKLLKE